MAKQHTSVTLPGGLAGLVHAAQQPAASPIAPQPAPEAARQRTEAEPDPAPSAQPQPAAATPAQPATEAGAPAPAPTAPLTAPATRADYLAALAAGQTRWELFCAMGREYHRASGLGAVYIDRRLKQQLGQLRASQLGLSTSAILSAIVDQFLMEHADDIERVLHG